MVGEHDHCFESAYLDDSHSLQGVEIEQLNS